VLPTGPLIVGYYQTWSATWVSSGANLDLANMPGYVNGQFVFLNGTRALNCAGIMIE
jgi:hypothetical protein